MSPNSASNLKYYNLEQKVKEVKRDSVFKVAKDACYNEALQDLTSMNTDNKVEKT